MFLSPKDAQFIVDEVKRSIHRDINIMDEQGVILASTNPRRISQVHEGAQRVLSQHLAELSIDADALVEGVQQGINLPICLHGETVGVIGITGKPEEVAMFGSVIKMMTEMMIQRVWQKEQENQLENAKALFLESWLFSDSLEMSELEVRGRLLGIDVTLPRTVILLRVMPRAESAEGERSAEEIQNTRLLSLIRRHIEDDPQNFCAAVHQRILILLCEQSTQALRRLLRQIREEIEGFYPVTVYGGASSAAKTGMDLRRCYLEAKTASRMALQLKTGRLAFYDDVSLDFMLQSIAPEVKANLLRMVFSACTSGEAAELMETVRLFFKHSGNVQKAAEEAFIHKNTFQYRMQKVGRKTGYFLQNPRDAVVLYLTMQFYEDRSVEKLAALLENGAG